MSSPFVNEHGRLGRIITRFQQIWIGVGGLFSCNRAGEFREPEDPVLAGDCTTLQHHAVTSVRHHSIFAVGALQ
jgi:hypothetical protein